MAEDASSWYARKLAQTRTPQGFQRQPVPQYQQPVPTYQQEYAPPPQTEATRSGTPETLSELLDLQQHGQALKPGKGAKLNPDPCPNCGGNLFFHDLGKKSRGPAPAPHCFNCGFNELFEQGLESNWQGGA